MIYWYCPNCKEELDGCHVTYQELCEYCGTQVLSVEESISPARLTEILEAERKGRLVVLPIPEESDYEGLKVKYRVYKARNNELVEDCFVLRPDKDPAAVAALTAYAKMTDNKQLSEDIFNWITPDEKVVVLPCKEFYEKAGDALFLVDDGDIIEVIHCGTQISPDGEIYAIVAADDKIFPYREAIAEYDTDPTDWCTNSKIIEPCDFGKTIFLTREEAETALKEAGTSDRRRNEGD